MAEVVALGFKARGKMITVGTCEESMTFHGEKELTKVGSSRWFAIPFGEGLDRLHDLVIAGPQLRDELSLL